MKTFFVQVLCAVIVSVFASVVFSQDNALERERDRQLAESISRLTNRSSEGLKIVKHKDGSQSVDLQERFQNVALARINGETVDSSCVTSVGEANAFFGKDLVTGEPLPTIKRTRKAEIASLHGMSEYEYDFYSKLIEEALRYKRFSPRTATVAIVNNDGVGEGFNSAAAPAVPNEGGNPGTTLGEQRLALFNFAASIWGTFLDSAVTINVRSQFDSITPCSSSGGVLGSAGTLNVHRDFANAEFTNTWYHAALANKRAGSDLIVVNPEINATFNSDVDTGCLGVGTRFYYGLNNSTPAGTVNLLIVLLHEMGHGLGFSSFVNGSTGALFNGSPDIYTRYMFDSTQALFWHEMSDAQRVASAVNDGNVYWDGASVKIASSFLAAGRDAATGRVRLYVPTTIQPGSSISHFDTTASPNLLMEPSINLGLPTTLDLTRQQMRDIGWFVDTDLNNTADTISGVTPSASTAIIGSTVSIGWTNSGGFNRDVTIELSTDGGVTYPTVIAASAPNTNLASFAWTVPNTPTTTARIRVREAGFAAPSGASTANFTITSVTASGVSVAGRVVNSAGRAISRTNVLLTSPTGEVRRTMTNSFGYFSLDDVPPSVTYVISANHKSYTFGSIIISPTEDLFGIELASIE